MKKLTLSFICLFFLFYTNAQFTFNEAIGGPFADEAIFVGQTFDGGYVAVGWTASFGAGNWDLYLVKLNAQGMVQWTQTYGGPEEEVDCSNHRTADTGYITAWRTA